MYVAAPSKMRDDAKVGCIIAVLGGSVQGYILCAINGAVEPLGEHFALSTTQRDLVVSIVILGALVGSMAGGTVCDVGGRRMGLVLAAACFTVGSLVMGLAYATRGSNPGLADFVRDHSPHAAALQCTQTGLLLTRARLALDRPSFAVLLLGRVLAGVGIGFVGVAGPIYLVEMSPAAHRGTLVTANEIFVCVGCLVALVLNLICSAAADGWRWMLGASALPGLVMLWGSCHVPETDVWLAQQAAPSQLPPISQLLAPPSAATLGLGSLRASSKYLPRAPSPESKPNAQSLKP